MNHVIVIDFETLSQFPWNAVAVNLAATHFAFDDNGYELPEFKTLVEESFFAKFTLGEQMREYDRQSTDSCLDWWKTLPADVQAQLRPSKDDVGVRAGLEAFAAWVRAQAGTSKNITVWCRGQDFDPTILRSLAHDVLGPDECDSFLPYKYANQRDIRTWVSAACANPMLTWLPLKVDGFEHHNARHDVARSMLEVLVAHKVLCGEPIPDILQQEKM